MYVNRDDESEGVVEGILPSPLTLLAAAFTESEPVRLWDQVGDNNQTGSLKKLVLASTLRVKSSVYSIQYTIWAEDTKKAKLKFVCLFNW